MQDPDPPIGELAYRFAVVLVASLELVVVGPNSRRRQERGERPLVQSTR
jgi:hypothetical protein